MNGASFTLCLVRHGNTFNDNETPYQVGLKSDLPLTEKGIMQARRFKDYLVSRQEVPFAIYSGALKRQTEAATIIHQSFPETSLHMHEKAFDELDYGLWEGLTTDEIKAKWPNKYQDWQNEAKWPNGILEKNKGHHLALLNNWLTSLRKNTPDNALIVAVSSQGIIRLMLHFIPELWSQLVQEKRMHDYKVGTGHYCNLAVAPATLSIQSWNVRP